MAPKKLEGPQKRVQDIADELAGAAARLRDAIDEARPVTGAELDVLRADIAALAGRVAKLEANAGRATQQKPPPARKPATRKPAASATSKVPAARAAARRASGKRAAS